MHTLVRSDSGQHKSKLGITGLPACSCDICVTLYPNKEIVILAVRQLVVVTVQEESQKSMVIGVIVAAGISTEECHVKNRIAILTIGVRTVVPCCTHQSIVSRRMSNMEGKAMIKVALVSLHP